METTVFRELCAIARREAGINLKEGKEALVSARVEKRIRALGLPGERAYLDYLKRDHSGGELTRFLDVISTNFTKFMREPDHFEDLAAWGRSVTLEGERKIRIWCAAAATGEEPYSIAVTLLETLGAKAADLKILATDISTSALKRAVAGRYRPGSVAALPQRIRKKYFVRKEGGGESDVYEVKGNVKEKVVFRRLNLAKPPFPMRGPMDVVFCRNVMIYFDREIRARLVAEIERLLRPGGILFIGHSETLTGIETGLEAERPSVYRKPADSCA